MLASLSASIAISGICYATQVGRPSGKNGVPGAVSGQPAMTKPWLPLPASCPEAACVWLGQHSKTPRWKICFTTLKSTTTHAMVTRQIVKSDQSRSAPAQLRLIYAQLDITASQEGAVLVEGPKNSPVKAKGPVLDPLHR